LPHRSTAQLPSNSAEVDPFRDPRRTTATFLRRPWRTCRACRELGTRQRHLSLSTLDGFASLFLSLPFALTVRNRQGHCAIA
jgi:hypothetical protein